MKLLIDIGNSRIKCGISRKRGEVEQIYVFESIEELNTKLIYFDKPALIYLVDVSSSNLKDILREYFIKKRWGKFKELSIADNRRINVCYEKKSEVGMDRVLIMISALAQLNRSAIVVSAGTATTVDAVISDGTHLGGIILPGFNLIKRTLLKALPKFNQIDMSLNDKEKIFNCSTQSCLTSGLIYSWAKSVDAVILEMKNKLAEMGEDAIVMITGGDGILLMRYLTVDAAYDEAMVLKGMTYIEE